MSGVRTAEHDEDIRTCKTHDCGDEPKGLFPFFIGGKYMDNDLAIIAKNLAWRPDDPNVYRDALAIYWDRIQNGMPQFHEQNRELRKKISAAIRRNQGNIGVLERLNDVYYKSLLADAKVDFDAYCQYIERDREPRRRFYLPRRKILKTVAEDLQKLETGELKLLAISLPPGVGKSTLALFYITWIGGLHPDKAILTFSHDAGIVRGFYDEILRIIAKDGEYLYRDVFPESESPLVGTNAKELRIDLGKSKRFETYQFSSVGAGNAGKYRASGLLYCDDLCSGIEEALSKERMDKLWRTYSTDIRQRTSGDPPELHIATRWSVWDVIGRLERNAMDYPTGKEKFIAIPALNENDESNFDYPMTEDRFTTERYHNLRDTMDETDWKALFMNQPIEREGQLYNADELRRFFDMPDREPDGIVAVCDTKDKGSDYAFMPILYLYGNDVYVADCVCDNGDPGVVEERLAQALVKHKVQQAQFESNSAGGKIAEKVQARVMELGGKTKITTKYTTANKETKIVVNAPQVKQRCLFLDTTKYRPNSDYGKAMSMLTTYTMAGRNKHDDVPDGMAMSMLYLDGMVGAKATVMARPF